MPLRFPFKRLKARGPVVSLAGRAVRPRPLITISALGPTGTFVEFGLLDTGSDDTVFPEDAAAHMGLDLSNAPVGDATGVTPGGVLLRYAEVTLRLAGTNELREWRAWVGFTPIPLKHSLLGFAGFLQFFTATFHGDREEVELTVNAAYPGT